MRKRRRQQRRLFDDADDFEMDDDLEQECGKSAVKKSSFAGYCTLSKLPPLPLTLSLK